MPPPPSQKGKFKPRKPKKIVKPGEVSLGDGTVGNPEGASSASAPSVAFDPSTSGGGQGGVGDGSSNHYGNRSNLGRGGRGGRGRGGRGRSPAPQGRVFFTGGERKPGTTSSSSASFSTTRKSSTMAGAARITAKHGERVGTTSGNRDVEDSTEEVVGQLETAIGGSQSKEKKEGKGAASVLGGNSRMDYDDEEVEGTAGGRGHADFGTAGWMYDSDSSDEGLLARKGHKAGLIPPLELPFTVPVGMGSSKPPVSFQVADQKREGLVTNDAKTYSNDDSKSLWTSPFVAESQGIATLEEANSWFLVQLPTRLPPLKQNNSASANNNTTGEAVDEVDAMVAEAPPSSDAVTQSNFSEVITPPVMTSDFDNALETAAPGQIGRILVYKSGKTVLVMDGPDGKELRMEVNEGLSCSFLQEAVAIDIDKGSYVSLGHVKKSIVVSPDVAAIVDG